MNNQDLHSNLINAAKKLPEDDRVPYSFEKRIMAHLQSAPQPDSMALWARGLWQASVPCLALMVAIGTWSVIDSNQVPTIDPLAADLELTMLQPFDELKVEELW